MMTRYEELVASGSPRLICCHGMRDLGQLHSLMRNNGLNLLVCNPFLSLGLALVGTNLDTNVVVRLRSNWAFVSPAKLMIETLSLLPAPSFTLSAYADGRTAECVCYARTHKVGI